MEKRFEYFAHLAAVLVLAAGCFLVLMPFLAAALLAAVICISTWPLYLRMERRMQGRKFLAALGMTLLLVFIIIVPLALAAYSVADNVTTLYDALRQAVAAGPREPPAWLKGVPLVGEAVNEYWHLISSSQEEVLSLANRMLEPAKNLLLAGGLMIGQGVLEMSLAAFICFFFYRDGEAIMSYFARAIDRVIGNHAEDVIGIITGTVRAVMYGLLGTALAQGFVATIGFAIAGVPAAILLGLATFLLSLLPVGPPLVWGGVAIWLFYQGRPGWGVFMLLWGFFGISGVDNVVRPLLISRSSNLPFILGLFGVMGGILSFGFVGIFIGPTLLAVGLSLLKEWTVRDGKL
jgi:predicted PurR-regulated permease PerM